MPHLSSHFPDDRRPSRGGDAKVHSDREVPVDALSAQAAAEVARVMVMGLEGLPQLLDLQVMFRTRS